ncbi:MAG: DUF4416 family protein [Pseudomonadota bacterium]
MSQPQTPSPAKLVIGLFMKEKDLFSPVASALADRFGAIDMISRWLPFDYTIYYEPEMGAPLNRRMLVFKQLIEQEDLPGIKQITNEIEIGHAVEGKRRVNIDPGYLLHERFVLATGKNFTHRIYLGQGIYADLTLIYTKGGFQTLPWTYPDYASDNMIGFLREVRKKYTIDLKSMAR